MRVRNVLGVSGNADLVGPGEHIGVGVPNRRLELIARELKDVPKRITEIEAVHEPAIDLA